MAFDETLAAFFFTFLPRHVRVGVDALSKYKVARPACIGLKGSNLASFPLGHSSAFQRIKSLLKLQEKLLIS